MDATIIVSSLPLSTDSNEEEIASKYADSIASNYMDGSLVFLDYKGRTYPGMAKLLQIKGRPELSIVRIERGDPPAPSKLVDIVLRRRPGVVKLIVESNPVTEKRFYARLSGNILSELAAEESVLAQMNDSI